MEDHNTITYANVLRYVNFHIHHTPLHYDIIHSNFRIHLTQHRLRSYSVVLFTSSLCRNLQVPATLDLPNEGYSQSYNKTEQCWSISEMGRKEDTQLEEIHSKYFRIIAHKKCSNSNYV